MEIQTFELSYLDEVKDVLKSAFYCEASNEIFNEWEFAQNLLKSDGYLPELCVIALDEKNVVGYNALTKAKTGSYQGLALGPLGVRKEWKNIGSVKEKISGKLVYCDVFYDTDGNLL